MLVETYEVTEIDADGKPECEEAAVALIEQLGLEGQRKLIKGTDGEVSRIPYRKMTKEERLVYSAICPQVTKLKDFADSAIPLRVLQVAAHAVGLFENVEVWSAVSADIKDPVLVGRNRESYHMEFFLLARWGEELESLSVLMTKAASVIRAKRAGALKRIIGECQAKAVTLESLPDESVLELSDNPCVSDYGR